MKNSLSPRFWLLPALIPFLLAGCEKPIRSGATGEAANETPAAESPPEAATEPKLPAVEVAKTEPSDPPPEPEPEPLPEDSVEPVLEIKKSKDKIVLSGHFRSSSQQKVILRILRHNFPDLEVVSELDVGHHVKNVGGWGNRISSFLVPLFQGTEDSARFHYEGGKVIIEGSVPNAQTGNNIERQAAFVFDDSTITDIEVKFEAGE